MAGATQLIIVLTLLRQAVRAAGQYQLILCQQTEARESAPFYFR